MLRALGKEIARQYSVTTGTLNMPVENLVTIRPEMSDTAKERNKLYYYFMVII